MERDLYADLGVARDASPDEIKTAYRKLARQYHPDVNPGDARAEERFKEVSFAHDVLSDPEKRARYDEFGISGLADGFDPEQARSYRRWSEGASRSPHFASFGTEADLEDLLSGLFGAERGRARMHVPTRGADLEATWRVGFLDAAMARELTVELSGQPTLRVRVPPQADEGARVRIAGKGGPGRDGGPPGDLYLRLSIGSHPFFTRDGADLRVDLPITVPEALLGAKVPVPTPDGSVTLTIPPGSRSGQTLRLRGKGGARREGGRGDLYARLEIELPEATGEAAAEAERIAREMEPLYEGQDVRRRFGGGS